MSTSTSAKIADQIRGVLFGQAIGDALGFGTEWLPKDQVAVEYPGGLRHYSQITRFDQNYEKYREWWSARWSKGDWTDDTDQMLCILDSLLDKGRIDIKDIAARFYHWAETDGFGMGSTVSAVIQSPGFLEDPQGTAQQVWSAQDGRSAANGGVMRTAILGVWNYDDPDKVQQNAEAVCQITHADPRCIGSCVAVCRAICLILNGETTLDIVMADARNAAEPYHPDIAEWFERASQSSLESLDLDRGLNDGENGGGTGFTLRTLGAGFWALQHAPSFEDGILAIIHEGGDADTNAAVAGALMGAHFGYTNIPKSWINGLVYQQELESRFDRLLAQILPSDFQ